MYYRQNNRHISYDIKYHIPGNIANMFLVTQNNLDNIAGTFIMKQNTTEEIASRYLMMWNKPDNKASIFFVKLQA